MPIEPLIESSKIILITGLIIFISHFFTALFEKTRIPDVLLLIILGVFIQISLVMFNISLGFGSFGRVLGSLALALMLFEGGSHLTFDIIKKTLSRCVLISITTFVLTTVIVFLILYFFQPGAADKTFLFWINDNYSNPNNNGFSNYLFEYSHINWPYYSVQQALFAGVVLGSISPAVIIPILKILKVSEKTKSMLVVESAITDILSIIISIGLVAFMATNLNTDVTVDSSFMSSMGIILMKTALFSSLIGVLGAFIWSFILRKIRKFPNTIFTSLAFILILYGISELLHEHHYPVNGPISVLIFGLILANSSNMPFTSLKNFARNHLVEFTAIEKTFFSEILFIVKTFFFIYLGASIFTAISEKFYNIIFLFWGLLITVIIYIFRLIVAKFIVSKETSYNEAKLISFMIPKGLAAAVLADYPISHFSHLERSQETMAFLEVFEYIRIIIYSVVLFSIIFTGLLIMLNSNFKINNIFKKFFPSKFLIAKESDII